MRKILIDFETRSTVLLEEGLYRYARAADIVCMAYKINDEPTRIWYPGVPIPDWCKQYDKEDKFYAFNIMFDRHIFNTVGRKYFTAEPIKLNQCVDVMAICGRYGYPQSLNDVGKVLNLPVQKDQAGKKLLKEICTPPFKFAKDPTKLRQLYAYCLRDVDVMYELVRRLPLDRLSPQEQEVWEFTQQMNTRGVPVDTEAVKVIYAILVAYSDMRQKSLPRLTGGAVNSINQVKAIVEWANANGCDITDLTKHTVETTLKEQVLEDNVETVLRMRQQLGKSSVQKYKRILSNVYKDRIFYNFRYYGAATGRWSGMGVQLQNLPRAKVENPDLEIERFKDHSILSSTEDPVSIAKDLIRSCILAPPEKTLAVSDYSAIENRLLVWAFGQENVVEEIRHGVDQYKRMAQRLYGVSYDDVTSDLRQVGKVVVLGAGYVLGGTGLVKYAENYGISLTTEEAHRLIQVYREAHPMVVKAWYALQDCALNAVYNSGMPFQYRNFTFQVVPDRTGKSWLAFTLPSGRKIFYSSPGTEDGLYSKVVVYMGRDSVTKQWKKQQLGPSVIANNAIQGLARDIMFYGAKNVDQIKGCNVIALVHDEVICEILDEGEEQNQWTLQKINRALLTMPEWTTDLPMKAEGYVSRRYKKG